MAAMASSFKEPCPDESCHRSPSPYQYVYPDNNETSSPKFSNLMKRDADFLQFIADIETASNTSKRQDQTITRYSSPTVLLIPEAQTL